MKMSCAHVGEHELEWRGECVLEGARGARITYRCVDVENECERDDEYDDECDDAVTDGGVNTTTTIHTRVS